MDAYPSQIPSILSKHPNLPRVLSDILNLDTRLDEGQQLVPTAAKEAEDAVGILERHQGREPAVTPEVIETARNRASVIRDIHAQKEFGTLAGIHATLFQLNTTLNRVDGTLQEVNATVQNHRIIACNSRVRAPTGYAPLQKTVVNHGHALAQPLLTPNTVIPAQLPVFPLGSVPQHFNANPSSYTYQEILNMIIFYNDSFGILANDDIATRRNKFREWLSAL